MRGGAGTWVYVERCGCSACSALAILVLQPAIAKLGGVFFFFLLCLFLKIEFLDLYPTCAAAGLKRYMCEIIF